MSPDSSSSSSSSPSKRKLPLDDATSDDEENSSDSLDQNQPDEDVGVLSHAERRRQKKRELKAVEAAAKKRKLNDGSAATSQSTSRVSDETRLKRQNSVWVGNLSYKTTRDALKQYFDGSGEITRIHMPKRPGTGENLGFAYVDFATPDAKITAITLSEGQLDGRNLLIKDGSDFTGRPSKKSEGAEEGTSQSIKAGTTLSGLTKSAQKILRMQKQPPAPTLFLGNLGFDVTDDTIRELFEAHANFGKSSTKRKGVDTNDSEEINVAGIRKVRMGTFEDSGKCKGFAFVDFTSIEHATNALINPRNHRLNGRDLVVEYASAEAVRRGGGGPKNAKQDQQGKRDKAQQHRAEIGVKSPSKHDKHRSKPDLPDDTLEKSMVEPTDNPSSERRKRAGDHSHRKRARPGAALAQAPRQSAAILPSQGRKIVF
ncbi:hypothetical protein V8B97DRAFT_2020265 [Scleroderma yunnanense]